MAASGKDSRVRLRVELEHAIAKVLRQIEIDEVSIRYLASDPGASRRKLVIGQLRQTLAELEQALADLDADDQ